MTVWLPLRVVHESACPEIGPLCAVDPIDPLLHDQRLDAVSLRLAAQVGLAEHWALELRLPLRITVSDITYRHLDGSVFADAPHGSLHHRDETLVGPGDPWLLGQTEWALGDLRLGGFVGLTLPLGRTEEDPFAAGEAGEQHQHVQDGTGTVDPVLGVNGTLTLSPNFALSARVQARVPLYENDKGYQAGATVEAGLGVDGLVDWFSGGLGLDVLHQAPERWGGAVQSDGNLGATTLLLGLHADVTVSPVSFGLSVKFPLYVHLVSGPEHGELSYPAIVGAHVSALLGAE